MPTTPRRLVLAGCAALVFTDGFESGDVTR